MDAIHYATGIVKKLTLAGYTAYFAGGWVRDHLMHHPSSDIDIATDAPPEKILDLFAQTVLVGLAFGVVIVNIEGHQFEVASFRKDFGYSDGRKPDKIEFTNALEDAQRRDFTINGMFYDPLTQVVHDYVQGAEDLQRGIIRAIGDPYERFLEDRLRMIRAVRFAGRFAFSIDPDTQEAIVANADALFPAVAVERVWMEFKKMAEAPRFDHGLVEMHRLGLLPVIFPCLQGVHLNEIKHRTRFFNLFPKDTPTVLFLCELFPEASLEGVIDIFQGLHVSKQELKWVEAAILARNYWENPCLCSDVKRVYFYAHSATPLLIEMEAVKLFGDAAEMFKVHHQWEQARLKAHIQRVIDKKPLLTASFLQAQGISPGIKMGKLLKEAEEFSINQNVHEIEIVLKHLEKSDHWTTGETK